MPLNVYSSNMWVWLSCIDRNYHVNLPAAVDDFGDHLTTRRWSKAGRCVWRLVKQEKDYSYISFLLTSIMKASAKDKKKVARRVPLAESDPGKIAKNIAKIARSKQLNINTITRSAKGRSHCAK